MNQMNQIMVSIPMPTVALGSPGAEYSLWALPFKGRFLSARLVPSAALTAHDTNYATLTIAIDGTAVAAVSTTTTGTGNLVKGTDIAITTTGTGATLEASEKSVLSFAKTEGGSGIAFSGTAVLLFEAMS